MARENQVVETTMNEDGTITFKIGGQSVTFNPDKVDATLRVKAELHGWKQRIGDKAAMSRNTDNGKSATPEQKFAAVKALVDHYESGTADWNLPRAGGGGGKRELDYVLEALANIQGVEVDAMRERVAELAEKREMTPDAYLRKLATTDAVSKEVARIKHGEAEGADNMLDELMNGEE